MTETGTWLKTVRFAVSPRAVWHASLLAVALLTAWTGAAWAQDPPNLLSAMNPSFEQGTAGWTFSQSGSSVATSDARDGTHVGYIVSQSSGGDVSAWSSLVPVKAGSTYSARITGYVTQRLTTGMTAALEWYDAAGTKLSTTVGTSELTTGAWTTVSVSGAAPSGAVSARLRVLDQGPGTWKVQLDGAMIVKGSVPGNYWATAPPNLLSVMNPSFDANLDGWSFNPSASLISNWSADGTSSAFIDTTVGPNQLGARSSAVTVTPGVFYSGRINANVGTAMAGIRAELEFYSGATLLSSTTGASKTGSGIFTLDVTGEAPAGADHARLRVYDPGSGPWKVAIDAAMIVEGGVPATFYAVADSAPYATVRDAANNFVARYGAAYASQPGGQIQRAENHAQCGIPSTCEAVRTDEIPALYPQVQLGAGTFNVTTPVTACYAIWAYSQVRLSGVPNGTTIDSNVPPQSCPRVFPGTFIQYAVVYVGSVIDQPHQGAWTLDVSSVSINVNKRARVGLAIGRTHGPNLIVNDVHVESPGNQGIMLGDGAYFVSGRADSLARVTNSSVNESGENGINAGGQYLRIDHNFVQNFNDHGISIYDLAAPEHVMVDDNTITNNAGRYSNIGIGVDGSGDGDDALAADNVVKQNKISEVCNGIKVYGAKSTQVSENTITNPSRLARPCAWSPDIHPTTETVDPGSLGIVVENSSHSTVWENAVSNFRVGIWLHHGNAGTPDNNAGTIFNAFGLKPGASGPTPSANTVSNADIGIWVQTTPYGAALSDGANSFDATVVTLTNFDCVAESETLPRLGTVSPNSFSGCYGA